MSFKKLKNIRPYRGDTRKEWTIVKEKQAKISPKGNHRLRAQEILTHF